MGLVASPASHQGEKRPAQVDLYSDADLRPIFVLGFHRGGTTFLQRLINCSEDAMIWGEHRGILRFYAQAHAEYVDSPIRATQAGQYGRPETVVDKFTAWENKHSKETYTDLLRSHFIDLFAIGDGRTRWGFKEILYTDEDVVFFFKFLFPDCRILILRRDPVEIFLSQYFARWNKDWRANGLKQCAVEFTTRYNSQCAAYRAIAVDTERALVLDYKELADIGSSLPKTFEFLGLEHNKELMEKAAMVAKARVGSSFLTHDGQTASDEKDELQREIEPVLRQRLDHWS